MKAQVPASEQFTALGRGRENSSLQNRNGVARRIWAERAVQAGEAGEEPEPGAGASRGEEAGQGLAATGVCRGGGWSCQVWRTRLQLVTSIQWALAAARKAEDLGKQDKSVFSFQLAHAME